MDGNPEVRNINIGLDPGFGGTKAACIAPDEARVAIVPSVVGVGQTDLGLLSVGNVGRRRRSRQPDQVTFADVSYLVGESVARYARPVERMDFLRLGDGPELRALFYNVIFRLLGEACPEPSRRGQHRANVMVGLPVEMMADREQARSTLSSLSPACSWNEILPHPKPALISYDEVRFHADLGHLILEEIGLYFQCPLLSAKQQG